MEMPVAKTETKLSKIISLISSSEAHGVGVVDESRKLVGVIDDRTLRGFSEDAELTKARSVAEKTMAFEEANNSPEQAIEFFLNSHSRVLPVVKKGVPRGCITRSGVLKLLLGKQVVKNKRVSEFMHAAVTAREGEEIAQAIARMRAVNAYHLLVVDERGRLAGILSDYDIACKVVPHYRTKFREDRMPTSEQGVEQESVSSIMTAVVDGVSPQTPLEEAAKTMASKNITALAVVEGGKPVGLLTARGILHCCLVDKPGNVVVLGLRPDEKMLRESIAGECDALMEKLERKMRPQLLTLHVKSKQEGAKRRYAVHGRLFVSGRVLSASTPDVHSHRAAWDAHLAAKEVLEELSRQASDKVHSFKSHKRERLLERE